MREHGVNVQTPTAGQPFRLGGLRGNRQAFEVARTACKKYAPKAGGANLAPAERVARQEAVRKFAKCMREHGVPLEVETNSGNGPGIRIQLAAGGPNRESPAFQAAQKACSGLLPKRPGGGRGFGFRGGGPPGGGPAGVAPGAGGGAIGPAGGGAGLGAQAG